MPVRGARREPRLSEGDRWGWIIGCLRAWKRSGLFFLSICDVFGEREKLGDTRWEHSRCRSGYAMEDRRHGMEAWDRAAGCASLWRWRAGDGDVRGLR